MSSPSKRRDMDVMKLMMSDFEVSLGEAASPNDFYVKFLGPKTSLYEGGIWKIHVTLPANYPYSSPSIGFTNHIFHPNVDFASGSVCLDVINQTWSPMYNLVNVFTTFLPQLLLYPNPADPLNGEAAALMNKNKDEYTRKVKEYVKQYASTAVKVKMDDEDDSHSAAISATAAGKGSSAAAAAAVAPKSGAAVASAACAAAASAPKPVPKSSNDCKSSKDDDEDLGGSDEPEDVLSDLDDEPAGVMDDM